MKNSSTSKTIVFIHGLFLNPKSWNRWITFFKAEGYTCHAPAYQFHDGEPASLRKNIDSGLGRLTFGQVIENLVGFIDTLPEKPILIGHSMGGLAVQKLIELDKGTVGVCIDPAPPKGISSFKRSFLKSNFPLINPLKGNSVFIPTVKWFQYAFCNTMTLDQTHMEFDKFVVPEGRNIPRSSTKNDGKIDFKKPHVPLLFIAAEKGNIIPASLSRKNYDAYRDTGSTTDFKIFPDRTHYICGQKNWEEVAGFILNWISELK